MPINTILYHNTYHQQNFKFNNFLDISEYQQVQNILHYTKIKCFLFTCTLKKSILLSLNKLGIVIDCLGMDYL